MRSTRSPRSRSAAPAAKPPPPHEPKKLREPPKPRKALQPSAASERGSGARIRVVAGADLGDTQARILDATFRRLATQGYAALRVRDIAEEAGVNVALINYHFGSKDQLMLDVLDAANEKLLERQSSMYQTPQGFAEKWAEARRFYESDLATGFVRVQAELMAAAYSNPWLRERVAPRVLAWGDLIFASVREAFEELAAQGVALPAELTPEVVANWIGHYWLGMEIGDLMGGWSPPDRSNKKALDAVEQLLKALDAGAVRRSATRRKRK